MKSLSKKDKAIKWGIRHKPTVERFNKKQVKKSNGCIEFDSFNWDSKHKYRGFNIQPKNGKGNVRALVKAHRFAYALHYGFSALPVGNLKGPDSKVLNHICNNPACVNPKHLNVLTVMENATYNIVTTKKRCAHCNTLKLYADFYKRSSKIDKYDYYCKTCRNSFSNRNRYKYTGNCSITECQSPHYARKMCRNHYSQYMYARNADSRKVGRKI